MSGRLILLAAALLAGIMGGIGLWWVLAILLIWLVMKTNRTSFVYVGLFLVIGWGCGRADANQWQNPPQPRGSVTIPASAIKLKDGYVSFIGRAANGIAVSGHGSVSKELAERLASNDQPVQLAGGYEVARLAPARNQFEFDYATYAWQSRQLAYELVKPTLNFSFHPQRQFFDIVDSWRVHLFAYFEQLPKKVRQYAKGLLLGQLDDDFLTQRQAFVDLGVFHLFSISGLHLFALVASLYWLAARLRIPQGLVDGLLLGLLPLFLLLLPLGAGLWRAVWMRLAGIINRYLRFGLTGLDLFSMVLMVNLLWQPRVLMTMGGQLTYLMTGLLIGLPALHKWQVNWRLVLGGMPVIAWHTFSFNLLTVFFNWLLMPIFELIIMPGLVFALLMPHAGLTYLFNDALQLLETTLIRLSHLPGQIIIGAFPSWLAVLGVFAMMLVLTWQCWPVAVGWFVVLALWSWYQPNYRVVMFDVGQGDAILIESPFRQGVMLIDTGGRIFGKTSHPPVSRAIVPYLHARGYARLNTLVLTHPDMDHVGDAPKLAELIPIERLVTTPTAQHHPMIKKVSQRVAATQTVTADQWLQVGPLRLQVLAPSATSHHDPQDTNADSIVLYGKIGNSRWLFTGDADQTVEKTQILPRHLQVDYLKAGHHGSKTASAPALISSLQLKAALISAGVDNRYGHPHPETLATFANAHVPWVSTSEQGMLWVEPNPQRQQDQLFGWLQKRSRQSHAGP